jgi:hypothetical protein
MVADPEHVAIVASLPDCLKIPLSAALADENGPVVQVYRIVDAVETVLRFVVAHGAGITYAAGHANKLRLPDHPSFSDWMNAASQLEKTSTPTSQLADWGGATVVRTLNTALGPACCDATSRAGLPRLDFREFRNWIFHGGGSSVNTETAPRLVSELLGLLGPVSVALRDWKIDRPADLLWPVFREEHGPQMFVRIDREEARYAPLVGESLVAHGGEQEIDAFRQRLGQPPERISTFWEDVQTHASHLVGRSSDVKEVLQRLDALAKKPWLWLFAAIGRGKTSVMAAVANVLKKSHTGPLVVHMFRGGDARNSIDAFARLAWGELLPKETPPEDPTHRLKGLRRALADHQPIVLCDGVDELERASPGATKRLYGLAQAGGRWIFASRDVPEVREVLGNVSPVWATGLPPLGRDDLRGLLLRSELPSLRDLVLEARDATSGDNPWIEAVVDRCDGSPLYLELTLAQLAKLGATSAVRTEINRMLTDPASIPKGLEALYRTLVAEWGTGDVATVATSALCLLAQARGPLTGRDIAELFAPNEPDEHEELTDLIERALKRFGSVLRREHGRRGKQPVRLDHESFRDFLARDPGHSHTWNKAARQLASAAEKPESVPSLEEHLFAHGITYMMRAGRTEAAARTLTSLAWNYRRLQLLGKTGVELTLDDLGAIDGVAPDAVADDEGFSAWATFVRKHAHLLRRSESCWGAENILRQLACDYPASVAMQAEAEALVASTGTPPLRLLVGSSRTTQPDALRFTIDRDLVRDAFDGITELSNGFLVAWAEQGTVQVVRPDGREIARFATESITADSVYETVDGHIAWLSRRDGTLEVWDPRTGQQTSRHDQFESGPTRAKSSSVSCTDPPPGFEHSSAARSHIGEIAGMLRLQDGGLATWSLEDRTVRVWNRIATVQSIGDWVRNLADLGEGRVASQDLSHGIRIWDARSGLELPRASNDLSVRFPAKPLHPAAPGQRPLLLPAFPNGRVLVVDIKGISVLVTPDGPQIARYEGHKLIPTGAIAIHGGAFVVSWAFDDEIHVWDPSTGQLVDSFTMHHDWVVGAMETNDGRVISWSKDGSFWVWDPLGRSPPAAAFHPLVYPQALIQPLPDLFVIAGAWSSPLFMVLEPMRPSNARDS